jgi:gamma-glutamyltranspeptidase/glutathione hydrolase
MLEAAHRDHGRLPWAKLFEAAIELAEQGFPVSQRLHDLIVKDKSLKTFAAAGYFYDSAAEPLAVGDILINRPLAVTLRLIAKKGADAFYKGEVAGDIVAAVRGASLNSGRMRLKDLAAYRAIKREPVCQPYRDWLVCGMGPPSSGGVTTLQILGILQNYDIAAMKPGPGGVAGAGAVHLVAEASRLAFADRNAYIADPDFTTVPVAEMLDPAYLERRAGAISAGASMGKAAAGKPGVVTGRAPGAGAGSPSTTHLSVIDSWGNALSMTTSIERAFGSKLIVRGFLLNNQLTDFSFRPNDGATPIANRAAPGKRPRSSMAPTLVFDSQGRAMMALGSPGGSRIIGYVVKTLIAALDWGMDIQAAIELPHFVNRNGATDLEKGTAAGALKAALEALGHEVKVRAMTSGLHGIMAADGSLTGGADPRREGVAVGD